jgi:MoxR-like ATPase
MKRFQINSDGSVSIQEGSPLSDFLQSTGSPKTILINYDHFSTEEIIQFNEILDKEPKINGIPLPEGIRIIGLQNTAREDAYQESDFYSRFTHIQDFSADASEFRKVFSIEAYEEDTTSSIELYNDPAWKAILFGQLRINGREFIFVPGAEALRSGQLPPTLILKNAPVDDPEFIEFWRQAIITGKINLYGKEWIIPKDFQLKHLSAYDLETLSRKLSNDDTPPQHVLNSQNLHVFLGGQIIQNGELIYQEGLIKKDQTLSILLTETLSEGQWVKLLQACTTPIQIQSLAGINIPDALKARIKPYTPELSMTVVQTNDVEQYLDTNKPEGLIVDVSDFDTPELFGFTKALLQTDRTYRFESRYSWLIDKLERGEKVILKGHFSERIIQGIAQHILLKPKWGEHLTLIGDVGSALKHLSSDEPILFDTPRELSEAQAHSLTLLTNPELRLSVKDQSAEEFTHERKESIQKALESNPFVFITGLSGCGKTTSIKKHFNPYLEKQGIDDWLKSDSDPCYLFFDEANLSHENWLMFEGLLQTPAFIIFEGQYRKVPPTHKVIFAGNPVTYGDERKIPKLFSRHPNVIVFDPIPPQALKEEILLPLFQNTEQQDKAHEICKVIIQLYDVILSYSTDKVLISPRELQSIAMLSIANAGAQDPELLAKHYAYTIGRQIVPAKHLKAFEQAFKVERTLPESDTTSEFLITPSRSQTAQYLRDLLHLRTYRQTHESHLSDAQKTVGLGGFILEGEPGIGKSELLIEVLHHEFGLCKGSLEGHQDNVFYTLPPSISLDERKALLLKAFHEGAVVIVDEMNSGPMLESFLNALLMGATPDGEVAKRPGFTVLATQNPSSRGGRREQSDALLRRMLKFNLENYSKAEIQSILLAKGIEKPLAIVLAGIFEERLRFAKEHGKKPEPSFRDLMRLVDTFKAHHVTLSITDIQGLNLHLKKLIALGFSSDEMIQVIDCFSPTATYESFEPALFIGFLNDLKPSHMDILPAYFEKSILMNKPSTRQLEWVVQGIRSNEMKSRILNLCIQNEKLSPFLLEEILKIPGLLLPQSITPKITQWIESGVVLGDLSFVKFILGDPTQFNKLTQISDENFKVWCQRKPIPELKKLIDFCNSPLRAEILAEVIKEPVLFHQILNKLNEKTEETIITSFIQHSHLRFDFPNPDKDLVLITSLSPASFSAYLNLCAKPSSEISLNQLLTQIGEPLKEAFLSWYVDKKYQIYGFIFENVLKYPKLIKKIQHFSLEDFSTWRSIELTISHRDYCLSFQALNIQEKTSINFNTFILSLTLLRHLDKNEEEVIEWINKIELSDDKEVNLELLSNDFLKSLSPTIKSAIFCKLLENKQIKAQFEKGKMDEKHVYQHMLDSPELFKKSFEMLYRLAIKKPDKFSDILYSKLKESIIEENMKSIILKLDTNHQFSLQLLSYLFRRDKSAHHFKSENFFKEMHKILKKTQSVKEEKKPLHHQKLNDTKAFLIDIFNLVNNDKNSIKTEVKNEDNVVNQIIKRTEQFVKKHQDPHIYHYVLNFLLIIIPPFLIFKLARQCFYNENVFYNADNDLTRAAKTIRDEIIQHKKSNPSL